eukprot:476329-Pyramimonas_sp.AAC.1
MRARRSYCPAPRRPISPQRAPQRLRRCRRDLCARSSESTPEWRAPAGLEKVKHVQGGRAVDGGVAAADRRPPDGPLF